MIFPNYKNDNIVNLASSMLKAFDIEPVYPVLNELEDLKNFRNIILLVIDGLGYEYLDNQGQDSFFKSHLKKKLTSVFPSATAGALTTLETGVAPQQHGITGWFMFLKELGLISVILPFKPRYGGETFPNSKIERNDFFTEKRINDKIKQPSFIVYPKDIVDGKVNKKSKNIFTYTKFSEMLLRIKAAIGSSSERKYIYAYWDGFDSLSHKEGCTSMKTGRHFWEMDSKISSFVKSIKGSNSAIVITADHGLIDTTPSKTIYLNDFPELYETLTLPLCGESRTAYCYVRPERTAEFERYVKKKMDNCCFLHKSSDLIRDGYFGLGEPHKMLKERVGDYVLIMKDNFIIKDKLYKEKIHSLIGNHGGTSKEEIYVPLIRIDIP